ncbi:MAG: hypothetical protein NZ942_03380, partial [Candidatus Aenigmarchaeota archaeon]|nr:hypothetical protein [Candidatus Aenigmarchaeota archaeon]
MREAYKEPKTYKGFEKWFHEVQMTFKMHLYIFLIVLFVHLSIPLLYLFLFKFEILKLIIEIFSNFYIQYWSKAIILFFKSTFWVFIISIPVWFLYPVLLAKFKSKAKAIV